MFPIAWTLFRFTVFSFDNENIHLQMYDKQIKQDSVKKLKKNLQSDLFNKKKNRSALPKKISLEKKKKVFQ